MSHRGGVVCELIWTDEARSGCCFCVISSGATPPYMARRHLWTQRQLVAPACLGVVTDLDRVFPTSLQPPA